MKFCLVFLILFLVFHSMEALTEKECENLKRYCTPPCRGAGIRCMYNVALYQMNCMKYRSNCQS